MLAALAAAALTPALGSAASVTTTIGVAPYGIAPYAIAPAKQYIDTWLPDATGALWQYNWTDTGYNPAPGTTEDVSVQSRSGSSFVLAWTGVPAAGAAVTDQGTISFQDTDSGLVNTNWSSLPPPENFPILCATASDCANSLSSTYYNVIWGSRDPVLAQPVLQGLSWTAEGGAENDVDSTNQYLGQHKITVPAFTKPVMAAEVASNITQAGALGDPYGSGIRTTWWVYGVGPVKVTFDHVGGSNAPVTTAVLRSTNLKPLAPPPDANYFPLVEGHAERYSITDTKYLKKPEVEKVTVAQAENGTAEVTASSVSGPMKVKAAYIFTLRLDEGITTISGSTSAATQLTFPALGHKLHFFTPIDLMTYGFNPLLPAYPIAGDRWKSGNARDFAVYGVTGSTKVIGTRRITVPAGTFHALEVRSTLTQKGHAYGSGVRTMWFAAGVGLVKLEFQHRDGATTVVQLVK